MLTDQALPGFMPILVLNEHRLAPSFGYIFDRKWVAPHESIVSLLWKYIRTNGIAGHMVANEFSVEVIDPYEGMEPYREHFDIGRLKRVLGLSRRILHQSLIPEQRRNGVSPWFRYCPRCLSRGYHGVVHQFESVQVCPIHDQKLEAACRHCGYMAPFRLNARILERPFRCSACHRLYGTQPVNPMNYGTRMDRRDLMRIRFVHASRCRFK